MICDLFIEGDVKSVWADGVISLDSFCFLGTFFFSEDGLFLTEGDFTFVCWASASASF